MFVCITGVAGSGKSNLIEDVLIREHPETVVVDQSPVQGSVRSNPATYVDIFGLIRKAFAAATGRSPALFSFNSAGACPNCKGNGFLTNTGIVLIASGLHAEAAEASAQAIVSPEFFHQVEKFTRGRGLAGIAGLELLLEVKCVH